MKRRLRLACLTPCIAALCLPALLHAADSLRPPVAASPAAATITGQVQNAVTGRFLSNVRVSVVDTSIAAFTDSFGNYRIAGLPAGPVVLEFYFTGLDPLRSSLAVTAGQILVHDASLSSASRYGQTAPGTVQLDAFVVAQAREVEGEALATNEQRFSPNIKNVVATDLFGDVQEGNVGEFLKFLPGVLVNYVDVEARDISLRGFAANLTEFTVDGAQTSNANYFGSSRAPFMSQSSITSISRIEVFKVPTPSSSSAAMAGSVNMVSKSAFERSRAEFRYRLYLSADSLSLKLKDPYTYGDKEAYKILPNFDFDYTLPVGKNFGLVVTGLTSNFFNEQRFHQSVWSATMAGTTAALSNPYMSSDVARENPRFAWRQAAGLSADWRPTSNSVLSASLSYSDFISQAGNVIRTSGVGANATPTIAAAAGGEPFAFSPTFTQSATGRGVLNVTGDTVNRLENTIGGSLRYRLDNGVWRLRSSFNRSSSTTRFRGGGNDWVFNTLAATYATPLRISYTNVTPLSGDGSTTLVRGFANDGREVHLNNLANYRVTTASITSRSITDDVVSGDASVRRRFGFLPFPASLELGALQRIQKRDTRIPVRNFTYNGNNGDFSALPYQMKVYVNQDSGFGVHDLALINPGAASRAYKADPRLFTQTPAQLAAEATSRITTSEHLQEKVTAWYGQLEFQLLHNRLKVLTGVRHEETAAQGEGPVFDPAAAFVREANGRIALDSRGQRIRKSEAGAAGSLEEVLLTRQERGNHARGGYDGYYPSLHLTANVSANFVARLAYARTYGRPNFSDIIPNVVINERDLTAEELSDPSVVPGSLTVRNPNLKPWAADNYDLSLEYYTP